MGIQNDMFEKDKILFLIKTERFSKINTKKKKKELTLSPIKYISLQFREILGQNRRESTKREKKYKEEKNSEEQEEEEKINKLI